MAILAVRIGDEGSLRLNEFFDYDGKCYALTRSRERSDKTCIDLADFYEGTVQSTVMQGVPVIFVLGEDGDDCKVCGWYRSADVYRDIRRPSLFLEGNVVCLSGEAMLLPEKARMPMSAPLFGGVYRVIEEDDADHKRLQELMESYRGENECLRADHIRIAVDASCRRSFEACIERCSEYAEQIMTDACEDVRGIKALEAYAQQAVTLSGRSADGHYYLAMACYQLGKAKAGMKAVEKALRIEPDAADIIALKGSLLVSMGYAGEGAGHFHEAWQISGDEDYLIEEGRVYLFEGQVDKAVATLKQVSDQKLLEDAGIHLKDLEKRWPFLNVRGFSLKKMFKK